MCDVLIWWVSLSRELLVDELPEPLNILAIELDVVVSGPFDPEGLYGSRAALVDGLAVGEVDDLVVGAVDHQDGRCHFRHFFYAAREKGKDY